MYTSILLTFAVVVLVLVLLIRRKSKNSPPGPVAWPFIGSQFFLRRLARELGGQHLAFLELCKRYGSNVIALQVGPKNMLVVSGDKLVQEILNSEEYEGRPWDNFIKLRNMGMRKGITMNDGPDWKKLRTWTVRTFRTVGFGRTQMSDLIKDELGIVLDNMNKTGAQRIKPILSPAVINVLWTLATGKRLSEGKRLSYFIDLMERRARLFDMVGGMLSTFPWIQHIAPEMSGYNLVLALNKELKDFLMESIAEHKQRWVPGSEADLIDMFLREMFENKEDKSVFTDDQLVMVLADLFIAGCITTSTTLDFLFVHMAVHQDVQEKVQKEIDAVIGSGRLPDMEDRPKMPYTEAVLAECQRMCAITPIIGPRRVLRDTKLENYRVPKNTTVLINIYSVHMDPTLYHEPEIFNPERFIKDGSYIADENALYFGKGKRRCPGEVLARSALFLMFVGVMQKYRLLPVPGKGPYKVEILPGLTLSPKPYEVLIVPR